jgi:hypothetical protein
MMQGAEAVKPRIVPADEALAQELQRCHGERALLVETRRRGDGHLGVLAVLDLDREALAAETERFAASANAGLALELIDRATWATMRRLQSSGILQLVETPGRVLHCALGFAEPEDRAGGSAARLSALGELPDGITMATPVQIRALVERGVLSPAAGARCGAEVGDLLDAAAQVLAACDIGGEAAAPTVP